MKCQLCKKDVTLPFKCSYCGQYFCDDHRLPEQHLCPGLPNRSWGILARVSVQTQEKEKIKSLPVSANDPTKVSKSIVNYKISIFINSLTKKLNIISILNIVFLIIISLPIFDSLQLMWDSPLTFSRTFLPKWWDLFPSEYPIPSINLLYVYLGMLGLYFYVLWKFLSKGKYGSYDPGKRKLRHYYYVIVIGTTFLYFFSEAHFFWLHTIKNFTTIWTGS